MEYLLKNQKTLLTWMLCLTYAGFFFPIRVSNISLSALLIFCLLVANPWRNVRTIKESPFALLMLAMYLLLVVGLTYSTDVSAGIFVLEKKISFLLFPLLVVPAIHKVYNADNHFIFRKLGLITLLSSLVLLVVAAYRYFILEYPYAFTFLPGNDFEGFTSIHYVYYAMYFACGSLMFIDSVFVRLITKKSGTILIALLFGYSLSIMILVASKTGIIIYAAASTIVLYYKVKNKRKFVALLVSFFLCGVLFLYLNDATRGRFKGLGQDLAVLKEDVLVGEFNATGLNMRLLFWKIQITNAWKDGYILSGIGTGDVQAYIDSLYSLPKYQLYGYIDWDSHNQWVHTLLQVGLPGVILLALCYYTYFKQAFRRPDNKLLTFLIITLAFSFTESILELNKGILFFSFMFSILSHAPSDR